MIQGPADIYGKHIERIYYALHTFVAQMQIFHGGAQTVMSKQLFECMQIGSVVYQVRCKAVSDSMNRIIFVVQPCFDNGIVNNFVNTALAIPAAFAHAIKEIFNRTVLNIVSS